MSTFVTIGEVVKQLTEQCPECKGHFINAIDGHICPLCDHNLCLHEDRDNGFCNLCEKYVGIFRGGE